MKIKIQKKKATAFGNETNIAVLSAAETVSLKDICKEIEDQVGIPMIRSMSVLDAFSTVVRRELIAGNTVDIDGLVRLRPSVTVTDSVPSFSRIVCAAKKAMKEEMATATFEVEAD